MCYYHCQLEIKVKTQVLAAMSWLVVSLLRCKILGYLAS